MIRWLVPSQFIIFQISFFLIFAQSYDKKEARGWDCFQLSLHSPHSRDWYICLAFKTLFFYSCAVASHNDDKNIFQTSVSSAIVANVRFFCISTAFVTMQQNISLWWKTSLTAESKNEELNESSFCIFTALEKLVVTFSSTAILLSSSSALTWVRTRPPLNSRKSISALLSWSRAVWKFFKQVCSY